LEWAKSESVCTGGLASAILGCGKPSSFATAGVWKVPDLFHQAHGQIFGSPPHLVSLHLSSTVNTKITVYLVMEPLSSFMKHLSLSEVLLFWGEDAFMNALASLEQIGEFLYNYCLYLTLEN
jgi:hypothetical protein